ncbi:MAG TPA: HAMP domain-containing sensor histidine kinase [Candidatus Acidoferrum sp.]|nr:HAMP domain-containing sensor histidine kinase [Candidatus Acidoferrum sp.]
MVRSLSARLLALTVVFVMLSEVLIFAPSAGRFRLGFLQERSDAGYTAILALMATPNNMVSSELERELLNQAQAYVIAMRRPDGVKLMLGSEPPPAVDASFDLRDRGFFMLIGDAFETLIQSRNRILRIVAPSPRHPQAIVEIVIDEAPMRMALIDYSYRILALSIVISLVTAAFVYLSLQWLLVRPMRRLTESMMTFRENPEDLSRPLPATTRTDELGVAQHELADMQAKLRAALQQKTRLAALGTAVTKINHDLRNILTTAQLVADRLAGSDNPEVKRMTPTLLAAIDRAIDLCSRTLTFAREGPPQLNRQRFPLRNLIDEVGAALPAQVNGREVWFTDIDAGIEVDADRDQLFRVFTNLGQNALQAGATRVAVSARRADGHLLIEVADNGPGLPPRARDNLFQPFAGSARPGGSGLGLAIARDLMHAHGGDIRLARSDGAGTAFELELPAEV